MSRLSLCRCVAAGPQVFNRPFLFFVVETTTQTVLFQGVITSPSLGVDSTKLYSEWTEWSD